MPDPIESAAPALELIEGGRPEGEVPGYLRKQLPQISDLIVIDDRVSLRDLIRPLSDAGFTVINNRDGRLVITQKPEDFR